MKHTRITLVLSTLALSLGVFAFVSTKKAQEEGLVTFATYTNGDAATYYNGISDSLSGNQLLTALRNLNLSKRQATVGYSSMGTTTSGQFKYTDYDPNYVQYDSKGQPYGTRISSFYTYTSATSWNREHVWPNSHGGGSGGNAGSPYPDADIHMPRPTISSENSSRGNSFYVEGMNHSSNGWDPFTAGYDEQSRGEAARIVFYCMTVNSNLSIAPNNTTPSGKDPITGNTYDSGKTMGNLETLLKWTINYPVTQREKNRNEGAEYLQGNRNAFIDHPEYACRIWGNVNSTTKSLCSNASWDTSHIVGIRYDDGYNTASTDSTNYRLSVDGSVSFFAYVDGAYNANVSWSLSDYTVASLVYYSRSSYTNGVTITGLSEGTTDLTATYSYKDANNVTKTATATCTITVGNSGGGSGDTDDYTLVTSNSQLSNGDKVVLTVDREREELIGVKGWNNNNDATVSVTESEWCQYTVSNASSSGFKLKDPSTNTYIAEPNSNHFKYDASGGTVSAADDGKFVCNSRYLCKNGTYYRCYSSVGSYIPFYIYKVANTTSKTLSSISLSNKTTEYAYGEEFVKPTVTAHFSDNSTADVTSSATCSGYNMNNSGNQTVTVSYTYSGTTKTATYTINVAATTKTLSSISVANQTVSFNTGATFSFGGTVTAHFSDGSTADVTSATTFSGYNMSTAGSQTVTASYTYSGTTKTTTYTITVYSGGSVETYYEKVTSTSSITSGDYLIVYENGNVAFNGGLSTLDAESNTINVTISNSKITANATTNAAKFTINATVGSIKSTSGYYIGRTASSNGLNTNTSDALVNTLSIDSGNVVITSSGGPILKFNNSSGQKRFRYYASGQQSIQLYKYTSSGGSAPTVSSISLNTTNVIKTFDTGDTFDYSGLVVTATYSDSTSQVISSGYSVSSPDMSTAGTKEITVSYSGKTATYNITVNAAVPTSITATVKNGKTFFVGETITKSNITVLTNTNVDVTDSVAFSDYQFTYDDAASGGTLTDKQFIITYSGLSATLTVGVQRKARSSQSVETYSVTYTDLPNAYDTSKDVRTAASGVKFIAYNLANYSSKMQFKASGGYFETTQEMNLATVTINNRESNALTVYGSNTAGTFSTTITGTNDVYDLSGYKYVQIKKNGSGAAYCSSITIVTSNVETAATVSCYIMYEDTTNQCTTKLNTAITYLNNLSSSELNTFKTSTDYVIATARERLEAWARNQGKTIDYSGGATHVVLKSGRFLANSVITEDSSISLILIITSALTVSAVLGYFLLKRKKQK